MRTNACFFSFILVISLLILKSENKSEVLCLEAFKFKFNPFILIIFLYLPVFQHKHYWPAFDILKFHFVDEFSFYGFGFRLIEGAHI